MFTKQHYKEIASIIANSHDACEDEGYWAVEGIAEDLIDYFIENNPNFDRDKFLKACGF